MKDREKFDREPQPTTKFPDTVTAIGKRAAQSAHDRHSERSTPRTRSEKQPDDLEIRTPHPLAYQKALELAGGDPRRCVVQKDGSIIVLNKAPDHRLRRDER